MERFARVEAARATAASTRSQAGTAPIEGLVQMAATNREGDRSVRLQGFGPLRDVLPASVTFPGTTVEAVRLRLASMLPEAAALLSSSLVFVDGAVRPAGFTVQGGELVQFLPPVSGG